ncbi:DMT family transporter [Aeromicrobium tamlense]|uniref:DMT family transporter n=1 Tax=Aeromicrobium tamlense TaxID=375541 RepID=A0A8I0KII0_9ACTN|nr:DMT family transporter [Aeromicrobium tamlense]MBD1272166.1 DMT family transporter [Aeromicrobium tamlense]NYI38639.1 drug/metabolite transporter (DMT)-like permease [Aeromicrobium tamlense]
MTPSPTLAAVLALSSALGFAFSTSFQHLAAGRVQLTVTHPLLVLLQLLRSPRWLAGSSIGLVAWLLHAVALNLGTLSLVQPIILLGVVLAVVVRSALDRRWPRRNELAGVLVTIVSLIAVVSVADTNHGGAMAPTGLMLAVAGTGVATALVVTRFANELPRRGMAAFFLGMTAGMLFGITACLMKVVGSAIGDHGVPGFLGTWSPWVLLACAFLAMSLNQRAYQLSRLSHSMPVLNVTSVLLSILLGALLFDESLPTSPATLALQAVGLVGIAWGLYRIADAGPRARVA